MKKLTFSVTPSEYSREGMEKLIDKKEEARIRKRILKRDNYTCQYCDFEARKYQVLHHIDGNPTNNNENNLEITCPMCQWIHHVHGDFRFQGVVDLYRKSEYSQNEIIIITRKMRAEGKSDEEIIIFLGLKERAPFEDDEKYLRKLFGFITSRKAKSKRVQDALEYGYRIERENLRSKQTTLDGY